MPNPAELKFDPITADWTYIRWLGDLVAIIQESSHLLDVHSTSCWQSLAGLHVRLNRSIVALH
jgi:hypothetical protein